MEPLANFPVFLIYGPRQDDKATSAQQVSTCMFSAGVVLYDGETCASFGAGMHAVPLRGLWEST